MKKILIVWTITVVLVLAIATSLMVKKTSEDEILSFEDCAAAGNPVIESYPPRCRTDDGRLFTQELPSWKTDGVILMKIPETGKLACFGCGAAQCIDPAPLLEEIEETESLHCTDNFEINGSESSVNSLMPVPFENETEEMIVER